MALVSITEASRLIHKDPTAISRDIERGVLGKTILPDGETRIDTAELLHTYGMKDEAEGNREVSIKQGATSDHASGSGDILKIALLEERIRSLERALQLEAELRRAKDQLTNELRARIADKENTIKILENKVLFLEYDHQVQDIPTLEDATDGTREHKAQHVPRRHRPAWWSQLFKRERGN